MRSTELLRSRAIIALVLVGLLVSACTSSSDDSTTTSSAGSETTIGGGATTTTSGESPDTTTPVAEVDGVVTIAYQTPVPTFDPTQSALIAAWYVWGLSYETLIVQEADGTFSPALATEWTISDDGLTYTFTLREGVPFHNGEIFEADDVVYTIERATEIGVPYTEARVGNIESVTAIDPLTVEIKLSQPESGFLNNLGNPLPVAFAILNREAGATSDPAVFMVGTGPFKMISYAPEQELVLESFDDYWQSDLPTVEGVVVRYMPEESAQLAALRAGEIDLIFPTEETALVLAEDADIQLDRTTAANVLGLNINTQVAPLDNVLVRQAMALAVDATEAVAVAQLGQGEVSGVVSPVYDWAIKRGEHPNYPATADPDAARALLVEAGYPDGFDVELLSLSGFPTRERLLELIADQLGRVGIRVTIVKAELATWLDRLLSANYELTDHEFTYQADPFQYLRVRRERTGDVPAEIDALEQEALAATSPEALNEALGELQQAQMDLVFPVLTMVARSAWVAYDSSRLGNVNYTFTTDWRFLAEVDTQP